MSSENTCNEAPRTQMGLLTEIRGVTVDTMTDLKAEMDRIGKTPPEFLNLKERAAILVGANQVLRFLEDHAKRVLDPPEKDKPFYDIPIMKLNQGVTSNQIRNVRRFISSMGNRMQDLPLPLNTGAD